MRLKMLVASALVALTATGCATSGSSLRPIPVLPADLRVCFDSTVPAPKPGPMTKSDVFRLIAKLKLSETEKVECGKRLIAFHDNISK